MRPGMAKVSSVSYLCVCRCGFSLHSLIASLHRVHRVLHDTRPSSFLPLPRLDHVRDWRNGLSRYLAVCRAHTHTKSEPHLRQGSEVSEVMSELFPFFPGGLFTGCDSLKLACGGDDDDDEHNDGEKCNCVCPHSTASLAGSRGR